MPRAESPVKRRAVLDSQDTQASPIPDIEIPTTGTIHDTRAQAAAHLNEQVDDSEIEIVSRPMHPKEMSEKAKMLAFMEEPVTVVLLDSPDQNPEPHVFLRINGRSPMPGNIPWCPRNVPITMARKFVSLLATAKPHTVRTHEALDADGYKTMKATRRTVQQYPFTVVEDANPRGGPWLRSLLSRR